MSDDFQFIIKDHTKDVEEEFNQRCLVGLEASGLVAERLAKMRCPVDTGRLRNSITHQVSGQPAKTHTYSPQHISKLEGGITKEGKRINLTKKQKEAQTITETIQAIPEDDLTMVFGTNVEYAPMVEYGANINGRHIAPRPYLAPALYDNVSKYEAIFKKYLKDI